jgi:hypothetical protein
MNIKIIVTFIFFGTSIICMEPEKQLSCSLLLLTKDIAHNKIAPFLSLQTVGCIRNTSRECNDLFNVVRICPTCLQSPCSTPACSILAQNYYACTKALAHCARVGDKVMFQHWWSYHAHLRNKSVRLLLDRKKLTIEDKMNAYVQHYGEVKNIKRMILKDVLVALNKSMINSAKTLLKGDSVNLFDLHQECYGSPAIVTEGIESLVKVACMAKDVSLLRAVSGDIIDSRLIRLVMMSSNSSFVSQLLEIGALQKDMVDASGKTLLHYAAEYNMSDADEVIRNLLALGIPVNCIDAYKMTPLHYAVKNRRLQSIIALLESGKIDVCSVDKFGKTVLDYVMYSGWESRADRLMVKSLLKSRIELSFSSIKGSRKGHSKI